MSIAVPSVTSKVGTIEATQLDDVIACPDGHARGLADHVDIEREPFEQLRGALGDRPADTR
jgi:hypothetical protein